MADPRTMHLDGLTRPWWSVPGFNFCSRCLGSLPPVDPDACSTCGTGTPPGLPTVPLLVVDEEHKLTEEDTVLLPVRVRDVAQEGRRAWWERFARWPNG